MIHPNLSFLASLWLLDPNIRSYSIESRNNSSPKSEVEHETKFSLRIFYSTRLGSSRVDRHLTSNPLMVGDVSLIPTCGNFIFCWNLLKPSMSILYRNVRNVRFVLKTKMPTTKEGGANLIFWRHTVCVCVCVCIIHLNPFIFKLNYTHLYSCHRP